MAKQNPSRTKKDAEDAVLAEGDTATDAVIDGANGDAPQGMPSDPHEWIGTAGITSTEDVELPEFLIDEVIGQDEAVRVAKKAARQRRHLLLLGDPGTGKSMIAKAMAEILPAARMDDVLIHPDFKDANQPRVEVLPGGDGRRHAYAAKRRARRWAFVWGVLEWTLALGLVGLGAAGFWFLGRGTTGLILLALCIMVAIFFIFVARQLRPKVTKMVPHLMIEHPPDKSPAPYVDATGSHAGSLLGDVRHDPYQSGGLETPTHQRVEPGAIHRANKGLLFIDEINVLRLDSQQALLSAMQDKSYSITGQSDKSSGAMVRTGRVPCDFVLVAAGNMDVIAPTNDQYTGLHPALRSRIRGYGYEVYVRSVMEDTPENRQKLVRFVAQEVRRDGRIPHFDAAAVAEVLREAQRRSGHSGKLTLRLRELGGLVRTAGDMARDEGAERVTVDHVLDAKDVSMSLEYQVTRRGIDVMTAREALQTQGEAVGTATGCTFMGTGETGEPAGIVVPVEAGATVASDRQRGGLYVGGGLEADENLQDNLYAMLKRLRGADIAGIDVHVQALLTQRGAQVGSLGAAAGVASISALEDLPIRQDTVVLGALAVSGRLRAVDGITQMVESAADLGYKTAVVPGANRDDVLLEHRYRERIEIVFMDHLWEVVDRVFAGSATRRAAVKNALSRKPSVAAGGGKGSGGDRSA